MAKATSPKLTSITYNGVDISKYVTSENITAAIHALDSTEEWVLETPMRFVSGYGTITIPMPDGDDAEVEAEWIDNG